MTPRNDIVWIDQADPPDEIRHKVLSSPHTRFPVCDQSLDNLLGIVEVKDLLLQDQNGEPFRSRDGSPCPLFLYEGTRGLKILEMFKKSGSRVAVVLDEYGTVEGVLTLTDILEAIVGDMPVGDLEDEPAAVQRDDGSWLLDGRLAVDEFRDLFECRRPPRGSFTPWPGWWSRSSATSRASARASRRLVSTSRWSTWTVTGSIASWSNGWRTTVLIPEPPPLRGRGRSIPPRRGPGGQCARQPCKGILGGISLQGDPRRPLCGVADSPVHRIRHQVARIVGNLFTAGALKLRE